MESEQHQARIIAEEDAKQDVHVILWIFIGLFCNLIGLVIALVYCPKPKLTRFFGKTQTYTIFFEKTYKSKVRRLQVIYTVCGFLIPDLIVLILFMFG